MADLNFPSNPQTGDLYSLNGKTYKWDGQKWQFTSGSVAYITSGNAVTFLNGNTDGSQYFYSGTNGSSFGISSIGSSHTFNIPIAGTGSTGLVSTLSQTFTGAKTFDTNLAVSAATASTNTSTGAFVVSGGVGIGGDLNVAGNISGTAITATNSMFVESVFGSVTTTQYASIFAKGVGGNSGGLMQVKGNDGTTGMGMRAASSTYNGFYSNGAIDFRVGSTIRDNDVPTGGTTYMSLSTTGVLSLSSSTASTSTTAGALTVSGGAGIAKSLSIGGRLQLFNGANYTAFVSSASGNTVYTLPATSPATGTSVLQSDTSGVMSWVPMTATGSTSSGAATTSQNINVVGAGSSNLAHSILFTPIASSSGSAVSSDTTFSFNPSTEILSVSGLAVTAATGSSNTTTGAFVVTGGVGIGNSVSVAGRLQMFNGANYTAFVSSASGSTVYTLPATSPATGSSVLQSTAGGLMSWVPMTAGASSGNTSQNIVVNAAGSANVFHPVLFTPSSLSAGSAVSSDLTITFNPSTEILNVSGLAITAGTASTNNVTGALIVRGGLGVSGQLSFVSASMGFTGITYNPTMAFIGNTSSSPITLTVLTDNSLNWEGSQGAVFSIDSNLSSGEIFSVSDISGLPIISASAGQTVNINEFGGFTQIGNGSLNSSSTTTGSLIVSGGFGVTGNANIGGTVRITNTTATTSSSSGALTVTGGAGIAQSLFVGGNIVLSNNIYSGGNTFTKSGQAAGDIIFDNGANDTAGLLYYYKNNTNFGLDVYAVGIGSTRFRIVKDLNESGGSELWSIDRNGVVARSGWAVGETINTRMYNYSDLNMAATTTISATSYTTFATITYTPLSSTSYLWIEFSCTYNIAGAAADDFWSNIEVNGTEIVNAQQVWTNGAGGGTRSGVMFPLAARYTNSGTAGIAISVRSKRGTSDDNATIYGNTSSGFMRIQEIGR